MHINATKPGDERAREDMQVEETTPSTPLRPTRAGFVRGLPLTMPVEEVIERGREAGIELQPSDIHAARYYMRQAAAAESSSIPQQLLLGGTFVTKREPRAANGAAKTISTTSATSATSANGTNGSSHPSAEKHEKQEKITQAESASSADADEDFSEAVEAAAPKRRGRKAKAETKPLAQPTRTTRASAVTKANGTHATRATIANGANGLHTRLQARLRNATFRETAREERQTASAREIKATVGKALLLDLDNALKPRSKRAAQTAEAMEEQLRLIALRVGTQRVREILDEMEELAARA